MTNCHELTKCARSRVENFEPKKKTKDGLSYQNLILSRNLSGRSTYSFLIRRGKLLMRSSVYDTATAVKWGKEYLNTDCSRCHMRYLRGKCETDCAMGTESGPEFKGNLTNLIKGLISAKIIHLSNSLWANAIFVII